MGLPRGVAKEIAKADAKDVLCESGPSKGDGHAGLIFIQEGEVKRLVAQTDPIFKSADEAVSNMQKLLEEQLSFRPAKAELEGMVDEPDLSLRPKSAKKKKGGKKDGVQVKKEKENEEG